MYRIYFGLCLFAVYGLLWSTKHLWHELLGVILAVILVGHYLINGRWFINISKGQYSRKRQLVLLTNILFLVFITGTIYTGLIYSKQLFPDLPIHETGRWYKKLHEFLSYITLGLLILHSYWHKGILQKYIKKLLQIK